ncbi:hypothetical protein [[Mycobacterium] burgundiense]|uniref:Uncharacterized protein n=1 Tax=[Mycobacterium] burgundiense TaxID=3064286 RepID=A0ABM9M3C5_9MYCO|nr:hypothetical protein [Mycolicibacterium sp. MU0053]CAJ1509596.1 hypothetical protein MU0053_004237 [Mycolicibacterium sp. MU0053]
MTDGHNQIDFDSDAYFEALGVEPPPGIPSDMIGPAAVWTEQLLVALQTAANADDPMDIAAGEAAYAERQALAGEALTKFPENEAQSQAQLQEVSKMAEQIPQMASGIAGGIAGALGGALKPLTELPQQLAQSMQGLMQQGMGAMGGGEDLGAEAFEASALGDEFGGGAGGLEAGGGGGGGGGFGGTVPMSTLGPAATPSGATAPTSGRAAMMAVTPSVPASVPSHMGGMGGYPMMPPGAMGGGAGGAKDDKTATKKVTVPSVRNGAPVQGRVSAPPTGPTVSKQVEGKTVATRRIVLPNDKTTTKSDDDPGR